MTLLLFPLKLELDLFLKHFKDNGASGGQASIGSIDHSQFLLGPLHRFPQLLCAFTGQGKVQMALSAQALCQEFPEIDILLCGGSAGALDDGLKPGDLVVGEVTVEHDFKVRSRSLPDPAFPANSTLLERWKALALSQVHFGKIASGDEDIITPERRVELRQQTQALCVAWEGAGGARAGKFVKKPYLEIRAITDMAGPATREEFAAQLDGAMAAMARGMKAFLK